MVKKHKIENMQDDLEITTEDIEHKDYTEPDQETVEASQENIISTLKQKLKEAEGEKRAAQEETQRAKADFLNARKRLEDERIRDRERSTIRHVEELIPLCDSFQMAMNDKALWEKADTAWRKGIEGIFNQLQSLLAQYKVTLIAGTGETFDPRRHEALGVIPVTDKKDHDTVINVIQSGYEITHGSGTTELIRPARVTIGNFEG